MLIYVGYFILTKLKRMQLTTSLNQNMNYCLKMFSENVCVVIGLIIEKNKNRLFNTK